MLHNEPSPKKFCEETFKFSIDDFKKKGLPESNLTQLIQLFVIEFTRLGFILSTPLVLITFTSSSSFLGLKILWFNNGSNVSYNYLSLMILLSFLKQMLVLHYLQTFINLWFP